MVPAGADLDLSRLRVVVSVVDCNGYSAAAARAVTSTGRSGRKRSARSVQRPKPSKGEVVRVAQ